VYNKERRDVNGSDKTAAALCSASRIYRYRRPPPVRPSLKKPHKHTYRRAKIPVNALARRAQRHNVVIHTVLHSPCLHNIRVPAIHPLSLPPPPLATTTATATATLTPRSLARSLTRECLTRRSGRGREGERERGRMPARGCPEAISSI
jgi:hypothetical protein